MEQIEQPTNDDPDGAENVGIPQTELRRPKPLPTGLQAFAGWGSDSAFAAAVAEAKQQAKEAPPAAAKGKGPVEDGYRDPQFPVLVKGQSGRMETNGKAIYISGFAPSAAPVMPALAASTCARFSASAM